MFKVGDEVVVVENAPITKVGDRGVVVAVKVYEAVVKFHTMSLPHHVGERFRMPLQWLVLYNRPEVSVELKIKSMYERQPYFLRYRSGQSS